MVEPVTGGGWLIAAAAPAGGAESSRTLFEYILQGGQIGLAIVVLSIVAVMLIATQLLMVRLGRLAPHEQVERLGDLLGRRDVRGALRYIAEEAKPSLLGRTLSAALRRCERSPFGLLELGGAVEEAGQEQFARLSRGTDAVSLVATIAPMLGLLGTVVGMVGAFEAIGSTEGPVRPDLLAGNISQALITTVLGLLVAIPATAAHVYLKGRIEHLAGEVSVILEELVAPLQRGDAPGSQAPARPAAPQPGQAAAPPRPQPQPVPRSAGA